MPAHRFATPPLRTVRRLALALLSLSAPAWAPAQGAIPLQMTSYLGAATGVSRWGADCGATPCAGTPTAYRFYGGQVNARDLGLEITLASLGSSRNGYAGGSVAYSGSSLDLSGLYLIRRAGAPWGFFLKGGLAYTRLSTTTTDTTAGTSSGASKGALGPLLGAGLHYAVSDSFALRAEWNAQGVKTPGGASSRIHTLVLGAQAQY